MITRLRHWWDDNRTRATIRTLTAQAQPPTPYAQAVVFRSQARRLADELAERKAGR